VFLGISASTTRAELARAVFEGTAFALRDIIQCLEEINVTPIKEIRAVGGGTKNLLWNQIKADVLQKSLDILEFQETGSLGAALLAGIGTGMYESCEEAIEVARGITGTHTVFPDPGKKVVYDELFSIYKQAYQGTRSVLHSLVEGTRQ
jgi:xylulokinase